VHAEQILKAPVFLSKLLFKLKRQGGGRDVLYILRDRLGVATDAAIAVGKRLKIAASPLLARQRFAARALSAKVPPNLAAEGWMKLSREQVEGAAELAAHCADVFRRKENGVLANYKPPFTLVSHVDDTIENPEEIEPIVRFCSRPEVFNLVSGYVGEYPVLASISLGYTAANSNWVGSQLFHCDSNEPRQLHLVMPIWPIDMESGPFTFLPESKSSTLRKALKHQGGRVDDDVLFSHFSEDELIRCTGEPGDVFFVNPYACFHCGARTRSKPRLILIVNFTSLFQGVESAGSLFMAANRGVLDDGRRETRFLLNLR
jgi:hypothetical protein